MSKPFHIRRQTGENTIEFSFPDSRDSSGMPAGGLINFRYTGEDNAPTVDVYRTDGAIRVLAPKEQPDPDRWLVMSSEHGGCAQPQRASSLRESWRNHLSAGQVIDEVARTGRSGSFETPAGLCTVRRADPGEIPAEPQPRRYLAVKLDAGLDANGNGRRGWRVFIDQPAPLPLGWVEDEHGRADSDSMYGLCSAILDAEGAEHMARTGAQSYPHDVHALITSGRVRVLCSLSVPFSEVREARRTPFKLPA